MAYMCNISERPDGSLPPDKWFKVTAETKEGALQCACNRIKLEDLPATVHIASDKLLYSNGTPMITTGYKLEVVS